MRRRYSHFIYETLGLQSGRQQSGKVAASRRIVVAVDMVLILILVEDSLRVTLGIAEEGDKIPS